MKNVKLPFDFNADKSQNNLDIVINLRKEDTINYQLVYASQLYGTFFCVFAKLNIADKKLVTIELRLVNYKGQINIGMLPETCGTWVDGSEGFEITMHLKANDGKHQYNEGDEIIVACNEKPIADLDHIVFRRALHPMYQIANEEFVKQLSKGLFDSEFFNRDGAFITTKYHLDDLYKDYKSKISKSPNLVVKSDGVCNTSYVELV